MRTLRTLQGRHLRELEALARREGSLSVLERRRADGLALAIAPAMRDASLLMMDMGESISIPPASLPEPSMLLTYTVVLIK